jgi:Cdc6-like AAA superfamily ATPase
MLNLLIDEFNCNHQADIDSDQQVEIFNRELEKKSMLDFIVRNLKKKRSGLMYICGQPGTGKTSTLNLVLSQIHKDFKISLMSPIEVFMNNAMTYTHVRSYGFVLLRDILERFDNTGKSH